MKLFGLLFISLALFGCSQSGKVSQADQADAMYAKASRVIANNFGKELKAELMGAMNEGGAANAIKVCATEAPKIAAAHSTNEFVRVSRITDRNRNPENLADSAQMEVLAAMAADSSISEMHEWRGDGENRTFCYYQAIRVNQLCIKCHGSRETIDPTVLETLTNDYPGDRAVDYEVGDFRGAFLVEVDLPGGEEYLNSLVSSNE